MDGDSLECNLDYEISVEENNDPGNTADLGGKALKGNKTFRKKRYIIFVGNLSYKAKMPEIESFFNKKCGGKGSVISVRILSDKKTKKSKGFAFVEFKNEDCFNKGLDCHHKILGNRRINVEMTVGGGGNTSNARKEKILKKNEWLAKKRVTEGSIKSGPNSIAVKPRPNPKSK